MSDNVFTLPIGNGLTLRLEDRAAPRYVTGSLFRGRYPNGTRIATFIAHADDISRIGLDAARAGNPDSLWLASANIELTANAAKRIATWLGSRGIGLRFAATPAADTTDALDRLDLNTDTPAPVAPGGMA